MRLIAEPRFDFMRQRRLALALSLALLVISGLSLGLRGLAFGIDFSGGTLVEIGYQESVDLEPLRARLDDAGFTDFQVQHFGTGRDVLVRAAPLEGVPQAQLGDRIVAALRGSGAFELRRIEYVGPQVGEDLREDGGLALLFALAGILIYVAFRFEYRFAFGAVIALVHDVLLTVGFFSLTGIEFDLSVLAAVLAVIGYSLNDTIVVFDRVRENFLGSRKGDDQALVNISINQTLARTLVTSMTTMLVLLSMLLLGGEAVGGFVIAMMVGVVVGTYSSIYVGGASLLFFGVTRKDMIPAKKEGADVGGPGPFGQF